MVSIYTCRDCTKCTERGFTTRIKRWLNAILILSTLGLSIPIARMIRSGRQLCPHCGHPLARHIVLENGAFKD